MAIHRMAVPRPSERREAVEVEGLGEVIVRQLRLPEMLAIKARQYEAIAASEGEAAADAAAAAGISTDRTEEIAQLLAWCVVDVEGKPIMTVDEWHVAGVQLPLDSVLDLVARIRKLSEPQKKTTTDP